LIAFPLLVVLLSPSVADARGRAKVVHFGRGERPGVAVVAQTYESSLVRPHARPLIADVTPAVAEPQPTTAGLAAETTFTAGGAPGAAALDPQPCLRRKWAGFSFCVPASSPKGKPGKQKPSVTPEQVARILADRAIALAPDPRIQVTPERIGVTGLDSYFWADRPAPITASAAVGGVIVTAEARPVQWVWDFGDGDDLVTSDAGRPYGGGEPGNIAHVYESLGRYDLSVEAIWEARWHVGRGEWRSLGYFSNSASRTYPVRQVIPILFPSE
jgi:hypothetical protein